VYVNTMTFKLILITLPRFILSEKIYVKYIEIATRIWLKIRGEQRRFAIEETSCENSNRKIRFWNITSDKEIVTTPSGYRVSRFLKGFDHAADRQWNRYGVAQLTKGCQIDSVLDVGANIGEFTRACVNRSVRTVYAFEPDEVPLACLKINITSDTVKIYDFPLGEVIETRLFYSAPKNADSSLIKPRTKSQEKLVDIYTLDSIPFSFEKSDSILLKMDAEGAEPEVLKGATLTLAKIKWVAIDVGPEREGKGTYRAVQEILEQSGFKVWKHSTWIVHGERQ
jgi:FkbM family methyltransferase